MILVIRESTGALLIQNKVAWVLKVSDFASPDGITQDIFTAKGQLIGSSAADTPVRIPAASGDGLALISRSAEASGVTWETPSVSVGDTTNWLLNGGFDFAQRQAAATYTTIANEKYSADRWRVTRENGDIQYARESVITDAALTSEYAGKFKKITNAGKVLVYQTVIGSNSIALRNKSLIFQAKIKVGSAATLRMAILENQAAATVDVLPANLVTSWNADTVNPTFATNIAVVGTVESHAATSSWQTFSVTATVPGNSKNLIVAIWSDSDLAIGNEIFIAEAGLYQGGTLFAWSPRPIAEELRSISFYGQNVFMGNAVFIAQGYRYQTQYIFAFVTMPTMRTTPAAVDHNVTAWATTTPTTTQIAARDSGGTYITISGALTVSWGHFGPANAKVVIQAGTSFSGAAGAIVELQVGPNVIFFIDAEL